MMLPEGTLEGRVAVITGGGTGLGKAMAKLFVRLGAKVVITSRNTETLEQAADEITRESGEVLPVGETDVRDPEQVNAMISRTKEHFGGGVDVLVNNAAGNFLGRAIDLSPNAWNAVINIVLNGTWFCSQAAAKEMISQGRGGAILNIIATYAHTGAPGTAHSGAAKAGVLNLTQSLAVEWASYGIRVNAIAPGLMATEKTTEQLFGSGEYVDEMTQEIPAGRFATVEEVANVASFLVSDHADYITGATLTIDGGESLNKGFLRFAENLPSRQA
jgi:NAD(P)-dependent dehydrogenase (short-subunit alcohol dehydrogenase family)